MTLPTIIATGNLGGDPELKFTPSNRAVCSFNIGCNKNKKNDAGEWETTATTWLRVSLWGAEAERAAGTLKKGDQVTITGQLLVLQYDRTDGTKGTSVEVEFATVSMPKIREDQNRPAQAAGDAWASAPAVPAQQWAPPSSDPQQNPWGQPTTDQPPF